MPFGALRRTATGFVREQFTAGTTVPLPEIACELPLAELYEDVDLPAVDE
ncbi:MAG: hypothetical protein WAT39_22000 [Planctomycetota bacterium]